MRLRRPMASRATVTQLLRDIAAERIAAPEGLARLYPVVYDELRRHAHAMLRDQRPGHTLDTTALVHEAYLKLVGQSRITSQSRAQFFSLAAKAMRSVLVDHARRKTSKKRGGSWHQVTLDEQLGAQPTISFEVLSLHEALEKLAEKDERMAQVVEMRVFAGLTAQAVAHVLGVSKRTVDNDWRVARAWLSDRMALADPR
jgi:RNA polymerase sigma factor (TIGR02999 family)